MTKTYHVSYGYHSFTIKAGDTVEVDKAGNIFVISKRGKRTDLKKNINTQPASYRGKVLAGDVVGINSVIGAYLTPARAKDDDPIFEVWPTVSSFIDVKFKRFTDKKGQVLYWLPYGEYKLISSSRSGERLLYAEKNGRLLFPKSEGLARDIPITVEYVEKCKRTARDLLKAAELSRMAELETPKDEVRLTKAQRARQERNEKRRQLLIQKQIAEEVKVEAIKSIPATELTLVQQIVQKCVGTPRADEIEADRIAQLADRFTKEELAERAKIAYRKYREDHGLPPL